MLRVFYGSGELGTEVPYENDERQGTSLSYYKSGTLKSKEFFRQDLRQGAKEIYYENGQLKSSVNYEMVKKKALRKTIIKMDN